MNRRTVRASVSCLISLMASASFAATYYVNDTNTAGDVWCAAPGSAANPGTSSNAPALSIQQIVDAYALTGGDTVRVDAGTYPLALNLVIGAADSGSAGGGVVTILGAGPALAVVDAAGLSYGIHLDGASYVTVRDLRIRGGGQGVRMENGGHNALRDCEVTACGIGVVLAGGGDHAVEGCAIHHNAQQGVMGSGCAAALLSGNQVYGHSNTGNGRGVDLFACPGATLNGNVVFSNHLDGAQMSSSASVRLSGNEAYANGAWGLRLSGCNSARVDGNVVRQNGGGVKAESCPALDLSENRMLSNISRGVQVSSGVAGIRNNLVYANGGGGLSLHDAGASVVAHNTAYRNGGGNLALSGNYANAQVYNNILVAEGTGQVCLSVDDLSAGFYSDYNDFRAEGGAFVWYWKGTRFTLGSWQHYSDHDRHSLDVDPLFVDPDGADDVLGGAGWADDDFHLQSTAGSWHGGAWTADAATSLCVDAGDPQAGWSAEPAPNGSRANLGFEGGTAQASKSAGQRALRLLFPHDGIHFRRIRARWAASGPWSSNDLVNVEYSADDGATWATCLNAGALTNDVCLYGWDLAGVATGAQYRLRVSWVGDTNVTDRSDAAFRILDAGPKTLYVNNDSTDGDEWCAAPGLYENDGLSPSSPLDSFTAMIERYPEIGAGDTVRIDSGLYAEERTLFLNDANRGQASSHLVIAGSAASPTVLCVSNIVDEVVFLDGSDFIRLDRLRLEGGRYGVRARAAAPAVFDGLQIANCEITNSREYAIWLTGCTNALVASNEWHHTRGAWMEVGNGEVAFNRVWSNAEPAHVAGSGWIRGNVCTNNTSGGISADGLFRVEANTCSGNRWGLFASGPVSVSSNHVYGNSDYGLGLHGDVTARCNVVHHQGGDGLQIQYRAQVRNNLLYDNGGFNARVLNYSTVLLENNTLAGGSGLVLPQATAIVTNRNNIIRAAGVGKTAVHVAGPGNTFLSDYNDLHASDGAAVGYWAGTRPTLQAWQQVTFQDANSLAIDPLFAAAGTNFHLQSTAGRYAGEPFTAPGGGSFAADAALSFCIDAGDPATPYGAESADNGGRVNLGAFGNAPDASRSPGVRMTLLTEPNGGDQWFGVRRISWLTRGPWLAGDTVRLEWSTNGVDWTTITNGLDYAAGGFDWDTSAMPAGSGYSVRVAKSDGTAADASDAAFTISASGPRTYFVNDGSTSNDVYCAAAGSDLNDGLSSNTPRATVQAILDTYTLNGGDVVRIDTGVYNLSATIIVTTNDMGSAGHPVVFSGSPAGSVLDRGGSTGTDAILLENVRGLRFERLRITGSRGGIGLNPDNTGPCSDIEIADCVFHDNTQYNLMGWTCSNIVVTGCVFSNTIPNGFGTYLNGLTGVVESNVFTRTDGNALYAAGTLRVAGNLCFSNNQAIYVSGSVLVEGNLCRDNRGAGISTWGSCTVTANRVWNNGGHGIWLQGGGEARRNTAWSNARHGIHTEGEYHERIANNLAYDNGSGPDDFNIDVSYAAFSGWHENKATVENNTAYGGNGIRIGHPKAVTNRNNVAWATGAGAVALKLCTPAEPGDAFVSDFNDLHATGGAVVGYYMGTQSTLADWQFATGHDTQSFSTDPGFVDPDGADDVLGGDGAWDDNFHLASAAGSYTGLAFTATGLEAFPANPATSVCVDAGDPASPYDGESADRGGRINLGAFGNTPDASRSPGVRGVDLVSVDGGEVLRGVRRATWRTRGPWLAGDTVALEYSDDGGGVWNPVPGAGGLPFAQGGADWDVSGLAPGANYALRIVGAGGGAAATSGAFRVIAPGAAVFYVNDGSVSNDVYCAATGSESNDGLSPATPRATLKSLLRDYPLVPGDEVRVDTGMWDLESTLQVFDSGSAAQRIAIVGSTDAATGTVFRRNDEENDGISLAGASFVRLQNLRIGVARTSIVAGGTADDPVEGVEVIGCEAFSNYANAVSVTFASNTVVRGTVCRDIAGGYGALYLRGSGTAESNTCLRLWNGMDVSGTFRVAFNTCADNAANGVVGIEQVRVERNVCWSNDVGISLYGVGCLAEGNRCFLNRRYGLWMQDTLGAWLNVAYANGEHGIACAAEAGEVIRNNLAYLNGTTSDHFNIVAGRRSGSGYWYDSRARVENNTVYGGNGILIGHPHAVTNRNNIAWATGTGRTALWVGRVAEPEDVFLSDFNVIRTDGLAAAGGWMGVQATLADWRYATKQDAQSFSGDPGFVDPDGADNVLGGVNGLDDNFHLASTAGSYTGTSFTATGASGFTADPATGAGVDAGDPASAYGDESANNGGRINLGAFGNTPDASRSPGARGLALASVAGGEVLRGTRRATWRTSGPWSPGDTVAVQYSADGGGSWLPVPGASAVPFEQGGREWDTSGLAPGSDFRLRVSRNGGGADTTSGAFRVIGPGATVFYVNDNNPTNDAYCTATGSEANDGLTPSTPRATLKGLVRDYALIPGDTVKIDTGVWILDSTLQFFDSGLATARVTFAGSTNAAGSVFNRNDNGADAFLLKDVDHVRLERLKVTGGQVGVRVAATAPRRCDGLEIASAEIYGNAQYGLEWMGVTNALLDASSVHHNTWSGLRVGESGSAGIVRNNDVYENGATGLEINGRFQVERNTCRANGTGLYLNGPCDVVANRAFLNNGLGLGATCPFGGTITVRRNAVYSNGQHGMAAGASCRILNNLLYDNGDTADEFNLVLDGLDGSVENNTICGGSGLWMNYTPFRSWTNRNNVIWAAGPGRVALRSEQSGTWSDFNDLHVTDGAMVGRWLGSDCASLADWRAASGCDSNSLSADPAFVDPDGADDLPGGYYGADDDFHLRSTAGSFHGGLWTADTNDSPCVDAGDPWSAFAEEPAYNGLTANLGAYGNTEQASRTAYAGSFHTLAVSWSPTNRGSVAVWPVAAAYPTNRDVTLTAEPAPYFFLDQWSGSLGGAANPTTFRVTSDMTVAALFSPYCSNSNGVPDWWFVQYGLATNQATADADTDGDGHPNWKEHYAGTVPTNALSVLRVEDLSPAPNGRLPLRFASVSGKSYSVRMTSDLAAGAWTAEPFALTETGDLQSAPVGGTGGPLTLFVAPAAGCRCYAIVTE